MYATILVALDGSNPASAAGDLTLALARDLGSKVVACHAYSAQLHNVRFQDMEPGLALQYREAQVLRDLRTTHASLICDGLHALSQGYLDRFLSAARQAGVAADAINVEGRNYARILETAQRIGADLIALGAQGLGTVNDGVLGSTAARVLRHARCDVLVARRPHSGDATVSVGMDGSEAAVAALRKGVIWSRALDANLHLVAAYDPHFHTAVFKAMAAAIPPERRDQVGLAHQQELHTQIIDEGLKALYASFLDRGLDLARTLGVRASTGLVEGKAYRALVGYWSSNPVTLAVVGRHGHHREAISLIGSNAEAAARLANANVLVVTDRDSEVERVEEHDILEWEPDARARLERVPSFPRRMAKQAVEDYVRSQGRTTVTLDDFLESARRFGMAGRAEPDHDGDS